MDKKTEFLQKLKALLQEYDASISWTCGPGSDTHGIYDDKIVIDIGNKTVYESEAGYIDHRNMDE